MLLALFDFNPKLSTFYFTFFYVELLTTAWIVSQWNKILCFYLLVPDSEAVELASYLLDKLYEQVLLDPNRDHTVKYTGYRGLQFDIGINTCNWTLWTSGEDKSLKFKFFSEPEENIALTRPLPLFTSIQP